MSEGGISSGASGENRAVMVGNSARIWKDKVTGELMFSGPVDQLPGLLEQWRLSNE